MPVKVQSESLSCFSPTPAQAFLLLSLPVGPNSFCTRKGFLPSPALPQEEGWECMASDGCRGLTPLWPGPLVGAVGGGESGHPHDSTHCRRGAVWLALPGSQWSGVTQLFDKWAIVLPSKEARHQPALLGVPPARARVGKGGEKARLKHSSIFASLV